eukprot:gnl/MRDRNA2_/MRDRNA2_52006_c0_seq1.p1 gnl/MRDRNA2_/MRDRNA2_52006_c0~~gnl/MRDRNA2_/MRDRNA2_52006_c0_seq1.p1  ORF type:complete len:487 (+),score=62.35 gnl/MRDRNA2_/MRDRNA2_52006_c0_seq1:48-1463(+)
MVAVFLTGIQGLLVQIDTLFTGRSASRYAFQYLSFFMVIIFGAILILWRYHWDVKRAHRLRHSAMRRVLPFVIVGWSHGVVGYDWLASNYCGYVPEIPGFGTGMSIVGFVFGFALVGRLNLSLQRWWEAKGAFAELIQHPEALCVLLSALFRHILGTCTDKDRTELVRFHKGFTAMLQILVLAMAKLHRLETGSDWRYVHQVVVDDTLAKSQLLERLQSRAPPGVSPSILTWTGSKVNMALQELQEMLEYLQGCKACSQVKPTTFAALRGHLTGMVAAHHRCKKLAHSRVPSAYRFLVWMAAIVYAIVLLPRYLPYAFAVKISPNTPILDADNGCETLWSPSLICSFVLSLLCAELVIFGVLSLSEGLANPFGVGPYDLPVELEIEELFCRLHADFHELQMDLEQKGSTQQDLWWSVKNEVDSSKQASQDSSDSGEEAEDGEPANGEADGDSQGAAAADDCEDGEGGVYTI